MSAASRVDFRWIAKRYLPKGVTDLLRAVLPESVYYPPYGKTTLSSKKLGRHQLENPAPQRRTI